MLKLPRNQIWAIDIKPSTSLKVTHGFHIAADELSASRLILVYADEKDVPLPGGIRAKPVKRAVEQLAVT